MLNQNTNIVPCLKVVGIGGAGSNAVNHMILEGLQGVEFVVVNTDAQSLERNRCPNKILLEQDPSDSRDSIVNALRSAQIVILIAGMGGNAGTGAIPVIAEMCVEMGIIVVGLVTMPFKFERDKRLKKAKNGRICSL